VTWPIIVTTPSAFPVAPEADLARLKPEVSFRDKLDLDSVDVLNFVIGLHDASHVDIPESDYPKFATLDSCVEHLAALDATAPKEATR
jgi:acyl carrier protein